MECCVEGHPGLRRGVDVEGEEYEGGGPHDRFGPWVVIGGLT